MTEVLPLQRGDAGEAVRDLQRRLTALGYEIPAAESGTFGEHTSLAMAAFRAQHGLDPTHSCDRAAWAALVEAGYRLGDRLLYHRSPMLRGDDVAELQRQLSALGFASGRVDGIFGPETEHALRELQRNAGITSDGVCGRDTLLALQRLGTRTDGEASLSRVRQVEDLRGASRFLHERRVALADPSPASTLVSALQHRLAASGASVITLSDPDPSARAGAANEFGADVFVEIEILEEPGCRTAYFAAPGFESVGGKRLAHLVSEHVASALDGGGTDVDGMRLPVLRETRMPAVVCRVGPTRQVVSRSEALANALADALEAWVTEPLP
jgi:N-acetylmuramoyl-L-alanine amidase